jgi:uncharacterized damage-inducible protein DinB
MQKIALFALAGLAAAIPAHSEDFVKDTIVKHLQTSKAFTLKVAEAMPEATYDFKLTPPQMSFAGQMVHLSQALDFFTSTLVGEKPNGGKPASMKKADVVAFVGASFDKVIARVSSLSHDQIAKTYSSEELGKQTGLDLLLGLLDHTTHHRASAEMYLRAKGITPPEYQF